MTTTPKRIVFFNEENVFTITADGFQNLDGDIYTAEELAEAFGYTKQFGLPVTSEEG